MSSPKVRACWFFTSLAGVAGDAERGFHEIACAKQALCTLARNLPTGIWLRFTACRQAADNAGRGNFQRATRLGCRHQV